MFTVIIPYRRKKEYDNFVHLQEVVNSIKQNAADQAVLISVFGSMDERVLELGVDFLHTFTEEKWNRSKALNLGVDKADTKFVFTNDADCRWDTNIGIDISTSLSRNCHVNYRVTMADGTANLHGAGQQGYSKDWPIRWDERYVGYGREDIDMLLQAKKCGLHMIELHGGLMHLSHPRNQMPDDWANNRQKFSEKWNS